MPRHAAALADRQPPRALRRADYEPPTDADLERTAVFRIDLEAWSRKTKAVPEDFPGAYSWPKTGALAP